MGTVGRPKGTPKTGGRKKGTQNAIPAALKDMVLQAAELAGGVEGTVGYLKGQALENPAAFMSLLGKILPTQNLHGGDPENPLPAMIGLHFVKPDEQA